MDDTATQPAAQPDETAIQTTPTRDKNGAPDIDVRFTASKPGGGPVWQVVKTLASLRLTVWLMVLAILLVFFGTLAQIDEGLYAVLRGYFRCLVAWIPLQIFVRFGQIFFNLPHTLQVPGSFPYPGGWLLGALLLTNLIAAHATRFQFTVKRSGVLLLHAGLIVLMLGELITGLFATEGRMTIWENGASNYVESHDYTELAIIDPSDPAADSVIAIPQQRLRDGQIISDDRLPFDVEVVQYMVNSTEPRAPKAGQANPATAGDGVTMLVEKMDAVSGASTDKTDIASAYVTLKEKGTGKTLGTYLTSIWFSHPLLLDQPQHVNVNGKVYSMYLRHKRTYKPFTIQLKEFRHDLYEGTTIPKNYSSLVRLVDPTQKEDREVKIYMNNPLRYDGETFYQSGFLPGDQGTILQVVRNPAAMMPYLSCAMVSVGMIIHFGFSLVNFLGLKNRVGAKAAAAAVGKQNLWFPALVTGLAAVYLLASLVPASNPRDELQLAKFGRLPVLEGGRVKPLDTLARDSLIVISGQQSWRDENKKEQPAIRWLLDVFAPQRPADGHKVFRIENEEVLGMLGLEMRPGLRYAVSEFADKLGPLERAAERASKSDPKKRTTYEAKVLELHGHLQLYIRLARQEEIKLVPPAQGEEGWQPLPQAVQTMLQTETENPPARMLANMLVAYKQDKVEAFNEQLDSYQKHLENSSIDVGRSSFEYRYNGFRPFLHCTILYACVFLLACGSWLGWSAPLRRAAFWLAVLTLIVHTGALLGRMYLMDRDFVFVTNLYSSAIFIGYVSLVLCLILEWIFPLGVATAVGGVLGFSTTLIAHYLARSGDTLEMLQAVLDTNFWLATHVTAITIGYSATFVAGFLGIAYIVMAMFTRWLQNADLAKAMSLMIYGTLCFATLLSFTGTVLGGIWADESWGRFWGWDPKENGALIIVMWNALILHARWAGMVKQLGTAVLAVGGNVVTGWSWFGTNQLGVGLHNYGFNNTLAMGLVAFWATQFAVMGLGIYLARRPRGPEVLLR